jgi:hypothetical protein
MDAEPAVILLEDTSAGAPAGAALDAAAGHASPLESVVSYLAACAPVIVIGGPSQEMELTPLVAAGLADFVPREAGCLPAALGLVERRFRQAYHAPDGGPQAASPQDAAVEGFGEVSAGDYRCLGSTFAGNRAAAKPGLGIAESLISPSGAAAGNRASRLRSLNHKRKSFRPLVWCTDFSTTAAPARLSPQAPHSPRRVTSHDRHLRASLNARLFARAAAWPARIGRALSHQ